MHLIKQKEIFQIILIKLFNVKKCYVLLKILAISIMILTIINYCQIGFIKKIDKEIQQKNQLSNVNFFNIFRFFLNGTP